MKKNISEFVGSRIKSIRLNDKLTQKELGEKLGVKHNTISSYEKGTNEPEQDMLYKLANILNVSINDFFPYKEVKVEKSFEYTYLSEPISAGLPNHVDGVTETETISLPDVVMGKHAGNSEIFITRTNGESMNNIIPHNSLITVKPVSLNELEDSDIVVYNHDNEYAVKRFYRQSDDVVVFRPDSSDMSFTDHVVDSNNMVETEIKGKVVIYIVEQD